MCSQGESYPILTKTILELLLFIIITFFSVDKLKFLRRVVVLWLFMFIMTIVFANLLKISTSIATKMYKKNPTTVLLKIKKYINYIP